MSIVDLKDKKLNNRSFDIADFFRWICIDYVPIKALSFVRTLQLAFIVHMVNSEH